jgi:hypothetical protein
MTSHKLESLKNLYKLGLNTPDVVLVIPEHEAFNSRLAAWEMVKGDLKKQGSDHRVPRYSLRTTRGKENTTPHHPNLAWDRCCKVVPQLIKEGYEVIIQRGINPKLCYFKGNFVHRDRKILIEYIPGPGTVRDLDKAKKIEVLDVPADYLFPEFLQPVVNDLIILLPQWSNYIFEWSIYRDLVGKQKQHQIYWEIRPWQ